MKRLIDFSSRFRILKGGKVSLVVSALIGSTTLSFAAPSGGVVTSGSANISSSGNTTNIIQNSGNVTINWDKFNISSNEIVNFKQPNVNSIALNRVIGNEKSIINGALNANGQVWILNSNGVLFGKNAKINTAGLLATTKNLSDDDFNNSNYKFEGSSTESVINLGEIDISDSGYATLLANKVSNEGTIKAVKGSVRLIGANEVSINLNGNSIVDLTVNKGVLDSLVENKGAIYSDGGEIYLTTNAVNELLKGVVNNEGIIEANSLDGVTGFVELFAHGGTANIDGTINAKEGFIETSGRVLNVASSTKIEASKWLLDPVNMTIESTGGNSLTGESISATAIQNALDSADVELQADENITVNENITWSNDSQLKLTAGEEIYVNAVIENTNTTNGGVYFNAYSNTRGVDFRQNGKVIINNIHQLQWMNTALNGNYELGRNIDATVTSTWKGDYNNLIGFIPIGGDYNSFGGSFDGKNYTISNLYINSDSFQGAAGFFNKTEHATIRNIGLVNVDISGYENVGGLIGESNYTEISNSYVTGNVSGSENIGGLIGKSEEDTISNSYAEVNITGDKHIGGLIGNMTYDYSSSDITNSFYNADSIEINGKSGVITPYALYDTQYQDWITDRTLNISDYFSSNASSEYEISTFTDFKNLLGFAHLEEYSFKLMNNMDFSEVTDFYIPILKSDFNGSGNTISSFNLNIKNDYLGFFGYSDYASISNLIFENSTITGLSKMGGLVGFSKYSTIENIQLTGSSISKDEDWGENIGGLIGLSEDSNISNSYVSGNVSGDENIGGLIGLSEDSNISNSHAIGNASGDENIGGLIGESEDDTISKSYAKVNITGNHQIGGLIGFENYKYYESIVTDSFYNADEVTINDKLGVITAYGLYDTQYQDWFSDKTLNIADYFTYNNGVYEISDLVNLKNILGFAHLEENNFKLMDNIDLSEVSDFYIPILKSDFNGNENTISNLNININNDYLGFFGYTKNVSIFDLGIEDLNIMGYENIGGLVGYNTESSTISNSYTIGNITGTSRNVGGLVGDNNAVISDSYTEGIVTGGNNTGGLVGDNNAAISNSYAEGTVNGQYNTGGLVGDNNAAISNSYTTVNVTGTSNNVGGLVGNNNSTIIDSYTSGSVSGTSGVGGLVGYSYGAISNSYSTGEISGTSSNVGGLVGSNRSTITDSYSSGLVNGTSEVGGLAGNNNGTITNSYSTGEISGTSNNVGGLVGNNRSTITDSYSSGSVSGTSETGGLAGNNNGTITNSYSTGEISGTSNNVGGLVGENNDTIINSYSSGDVSGTENVGGLVGENNDTIINSYSSGDVSGTENVGGLVAYNNGIIENSFWDTEKSEQITSAGGQGKTTAQLQDIVTFKDWDIIEDSTIEKGAILLSWQVDKDGENKPVWIINSIPLASSQKPTTQTPTTEKEIEKVITTIVNNEAVKVPNPPKVKTSTPLNSGSNTNVAFNVGENKQIVSRPIEGQATKRVTLSEAKQMQQDATGQEVGEVRVPLSRSSIIQLVDGGVSLPNGVEQEFYVADNK